VFGDSYSDIGAGYIDGNGPTAVAYLAWNLGLNLHPAGGPGPADRSIDFAVSGAQTGENPGQHVKNAFFGYGMINQVSDFVAQVKSGHCTFNPSETLFFIAGGLNDGNLRTEETISHLRRELELLRDTGARHFTLALLPTRIPGFDAVGKRLNPALAQLVETERAALGIDLWLNHWGPHFDEILAHPAQYGLVNTTAACAGRAIFDEDPNPVGDPSTFFFYHRDHPSTAVHRIVGRMLAEELSGRSQRVGDNALHH